MKKNLIYSGMITAAIMFAAGKTNAQTDWHITGNAGTTSANYCGTSDNKDFRIKTKGVTRMTVKNTGKVAIGQGFASPAARLDVLGSVSDSVTVVNSVVKFVGTQDVVSITGTSQPNPGYGIGVQGNGNFLGVFGSGGAIGVEGASAGFTDTTTAGATEADGVDGFAGPANFSIGMYCQATSGSFNTGIYAVCGPTGTPADSDNTHHRWAGEFIGDIVYSRAFRFSDGRLKDNIQPLSNILSKLSQIQTSTYTFKQSEYPGLCLPSGKQIGFIAENVAKYFPELVKDASMPAIKGGKNGKISRPAVSFNAVNYEGFIPLTVEAINEQQKQLDAKDAQIADLNARLTALEAKVSGTASAKLSSVSSSVDATLEQNSPNPFNQSTEIRYSVPAKYNSAQIVITSIDGKSVRNYTISGTGKGQITLNANELSVGSYSYSLNVDGKVVDTKTLVLTK